MSIVGPLRKFSADVLDSNTFSGRFRKYLTLKVFRYVYVWRKIFILFYLNWQTELSESDITPILRNESIQSDTLKKASIFFKFNSRFIFLWYTNGRCHIII